jgi:hypothetical protein
VQFVVLGILLAAAPVDSSRVITAPPAAIAPVIDGILEAAWAGADSATGFFQLTPDFDSAASERTVVYLLSDRENLYVAFRCAVADRSRLVARLAGSSDGIRLFLDTFGDRASCYQFIVTAAGAEQSYRLIANGQSLASWDGVWRSAARVDDSGYTVELSIPFKTLRYPPGRGGWGIDFGRYSVARGEKAYWCRHPETGFRVDRLGTLARIEPPRPGLHLEAYPVALGRADKRGGRWWRDSLSADAGLDLAWLPTPTANLQATVRPDFAQIEADPFQLNLTRYEPWLSESRPFFQEAAENFGSQSQAIRPFYSRRIGRPLPDGSAVPIVASGKYTDRVGRWSLGALGARTGRVDYDCWGTSATEPASWFSVASLRRGILDNSEVGLLYAGKDNELLHNHGASADARLCFGDFTAALVAAGSQLGDSLDWAGLAEGRYSSSNLSGYLSLRQVGPGFDLNGPGYTTVRGRKLYASAGPVWYNRGPLRSGSLDFSFEAGRDWDYPAGATDYSVGASAYGALRSQDGASIWASWQRDRYEDSVWHEFTGVYAGASVNTSPARPVIGWCWGECYTRAYNYNRGILAPQATISGGLSARLSDRLMLELGAQAYAEFDESGRLDPKRDLTLVGWPAAYYAVTPKMSVGLGNELVSYTDPASGEAVDSWRLSALYSWTFRPRSTFYFAWTWEQGDDRPARLVQVAKVRYLFVI